MSAWGYSVRELHLDEGGTFIAYIAVPETTHDIKKIRAFAYLENIKIPDDDDEILRAAVKSAQSGNRLKFSIYTHCSMEEWETIKRYCADREWENFALINLDRLNENRGHLRSVLSKSIERRAEKADFFRKWGFRRPW